MEHRLAVGLKRILVNPFRSGIDQGTHHAPDPMGMRLAEHCTLPLCRFRFPVDARKIRTDDETAHRAALSAYHEARCRCFLGRKHPPYCTPTDFSRGVGRS
jgi:hypothetical protein